MPIMARMKDELTSIHLPFDFDSNGNALTAWSIAGNTQQSGTPSPQSIIMPTFCGVRTGNLWNEDYTGISEIAKYVAINVGSGDFTLSSTAPRSGTGAVLFLLAGNVSTGISSDSNGVWDGQSRTVTSVDGFVTIAFRAYTAANPENSKTMLNTGSTALPYEPYGWAEKITSAGQTQTVYLGEVQTVRRVKKMVLDGTETFFKDKERADSRRFYSDKLVSAINNVSMCSHFSYIGTSMVNDSDTIGFSLFYAAQFGCRCPKAIANTISEFKSYLAAQYAAGTPVTVWYVLAEPETAIVNEPLAKIGDYADELHSTDAGITIPTVRGSNTLTVDTDLQPSAMSIRGTGLYHMVTKTPAPLINKEVKHVLDASGNLVYKSPAYYSWTGIREIVRAGKAPQYYPLGSIIYDNFDPSTGTAFQVVAYDKHFDPDLTAQGHTHSMTLAELKITDNVQFCSVQSMLVVETAMPAGTYRFTIPNYDATYGGNKTYVFTTTQQIPVGGCVVLNWQYQQQPQSVSTYATQTDMTALDSNKALTVWDGSSAATDIGTVKLSMSDPDSTYGKLNHIHRARYGSNNYYCSGIRQLINSDANSNAWWQPMDMFDRPYSGRSLSGKLYRLREDMVNVLVTTQIESIANTVFETTAIDGTTFTLGTKYSMRDKCFLLSPNEVNLNEDTSVGSILDYYVGANNAKRIKYRKDNGNAQHWWLRTPHPSVANVVRHVYSSGALNGTNAHNTNGCVAACTIQ